ncbi:hypothetical protein AURDEDRAFT_81994 [Auricularia subglabra TFB-10046 SS5]|nr:hypothetical protein AURDEDRAFT_81994 [Auricularia subglabra TFB-10046 SS5]
MGAFIWHEWARFVSITASAYALWSAYWGIFYRYFFWSFVGGHLRAPGGLQPPAAALPFVSIVVKMPIVQILTMVLSTGLLALELPAPGFKNLGIQRTWVPRIMFLLIQAFLTVLFYQGTNAAIYSVIAAFGYAQAAMNGEEREELKQARGRGGGSKA